jgi:hypothetical protein
VLFSATTIPDSVVGQFDATQLSLNDGSSVSTWPDISGENNDVTAGTAPTYRTSALNGNPAVEFDGVDDFLDGSTATYSSPRTVIAALEELSTGGSYACIFDGESTSTHRSLINRTDNPSGEGYALACNNILTSSTTGYGEQTISTFIVDGTDSVIRKNGTDIASGDVGTPSISGFTVGARGDGLNLINAYVGELRVYDADLRATGELSSEESALSDKWGIPI